METSPQAIRMPLASSPVGVMVPFAASIARVLIPFSWRAREIVGTKWQSPRKAQVTFGLLSSRTHRHIHFGLRLAQFGVIGRLSAGSRKFGRKVESRSLAWDAGDTDLAVHHGHQLRAQCQPHARAAVFTGGCTVGLYERPKQTALVRPAETDAGVPHLEAKAPTLVADCLELDRHLDFYPRCH